ncbi:calcium-dependent kinase [Raphidocelis subcapitata]|uniref:Calcium-dependent kinase n=1 Tax=Raphidocelis subcapitata TaxID=307507 RepID=A0A2V0PC14_9CHLO|nr:calcium-dependent kinase [Raphidocelis subcapitata]|eukprot:GBF97386.1 calcium-dependent kinase [Raphidocelis subcapitata]
MRSLSLGAVLSQEIDWNAPELQALSQPARAFLQRLLQRNPQLRPSAAEALEDPWLGEGGAPADAPLKGSVVARLQRFATYSHLKQLVLRMITEDMRRKGSTPSLAAAMQDLFAEYDSDASGSISFEELTTGLRVQGYEINESEVRQLMGRIDTDNTGQVEGDEFVAALVDWGQLMQTQEWNEYVDAAFSRLDVDGDGFIELEELLTQMPQGFLEGNTEERMAEAKRMLREADANGDGKISRAEFSGLLRENVTPDSLSLYDNRLRLRGQSLAAPGA